MKNTWNALLVFVALEGCSQSIGNDAEALGKAGAAELIRAGDPKGCVHPQVRALILKTIKDETGRKMGVSRDHVDAVRGDMPEPELSTFSAIRADPNVGMVTCEVNVREIVLGALGEDDGPKDFTVRYELRQSLEDSNAFIMTTGSFEETNKEWLHLLGWKALNHEFANRSWDRRRASETINKSDTSTVLQPEPPLSDEDRDLIYDENGNVIGRARPQSE